MAEPVHDDSVKGLGLSIATLTILLSIFLNASLLRSRLRFLPDSCVSIGIGVLAGSVVRLSGRDLTTALTDVLPNPDTFFLMLLPAIIFEAGYSLHKGKFFQQMGSILMFAIPGTVITAVMFGVAIWLLGVMGASIRLPFFDAMTFGSLLSAVDPVATLAIFSKVKVSETLSTIVLGESVLNDAVSISLFRLFSELGSHDMDVSLLTPVVSFLWIFFGSIMVGGVCGLVSAAVFRHTSLRQYPSLEISVLFLFAYWPFAFCEGAGLSGILAILSNAMVMAGFTHDNLSLISQMVAENAFRCIAFLAETFVFVYLGLVLVTTSLSFSPGLIGWGIVLCVATRACNVFPCAWVLNKYREDKIQPKDQFIMFFSGLRGAIAFALSLNLTSKDRSEIQTATLFIVLFTVVVLGGGTLPMLKVLKVEGDSGGISISRTDEATGAPVAHVDEDLPPFSQSGRQWYLERQSLLNRLSDNFIVRFVKAPPQCELDQQSLTDLCRHLPRPLVHALLYQRSDVTFGDRLLPPSTPPPRPTSSNQAARRPSADNHAREETAPLVYASISPKSDNADAKGYGSDSSRHGVRSP